MEESASGEKAARALNLPIFSWLRPAVGRGDPKRRVRRRYKVADQVCSAGALYIGKAPLQQLNCNGLFWYLAGYGLTVGNSSQVSPLRFRSDCSIHPVPLRPVLPAPRSTCAQPSLA